MSHQERKSIITEQLVRLDRAIVTASTDEIRMLSAMQDMLRNQLQQVDQELRAA